MDFGRFLPNEKKRSKVFFAISPHSFGASLFYIGWSIFFSGSMRKMHFYHFFEKNLKGRNESQRFVS